jgi:hypothetical protein
MRRMLPLLTAALVGGLMAVGVACGGKEATPTPARTTPAVRTATPGPRTTPHPLTRAGRGPSGRGRRPRALGVGVPGPQRAMVIWPAMPWA